MLFHFQSDVYFFNPTDFSQLLSVSIYVRGNNDSSSVLKLKISIYYNISPCASTYKFKLLLLLYFFPSSLSNYFVAYFLIPYDTIWCAGWAMSKAASQHKQAHTYIPSSNISFWFLQVVQYVTYSKSWHFTINNHRREWRVNKTENRKGKRILANNLLGLW